MQQITIRMPDEDISRIDQLAKSMGLKKSDVTRLAIRKFLDANKLENLPSLYDRAKNLIGVVESGLPDLGLNHRKHLINKIKGDKT